MEHLFDLSPVEDLLRERTPGVAASEPPSETEARQRSFDDLGTPLHQVTFCVIDLETTGGSPQHDRITEVGAVAYRGGQCLGTFQTLVNPGLAIPPQITVLTGITEAMVVPAPPIEQVLPSLLSFVGPAVIVGHNVRFDLGFLQAALRRSGRPRLANRSIDTCALARRLVRDEVPNCKLGTLADRFRLPNQPSHRALDDAMATADLLHVLLERAGSMGVTGLDDLLALPSIKGHPQQAKLRLTEGLPRAPGVYLFVDRHDRVLYVGKATELRSRVRSYFSGDTRKKVAQLLREAERVDHIRCASVVEAEVLEVRLIHELMPRFNRQAKSWKKYAYLKLTLNERFPRLSVVKSAKADGAVYVGPLASTRVAKRAAEAIETAVPIRRCTAKVADPPMRAAPCAPAQIGVASCPCAGQVSESQYATFVAQVLEGLGPSPDLLLGPLMARMHELADVERFEEASDYRDRAQALRAALARTRSHRQVVEAGRLVVSLDGVTLEINGGRLVRSWNNELGPPLAFGDAVRPGPADEPANAEASDPLPRERADEAAVLASFLSRQADALRLEHCSGVLSCPLPRLPSLKAASAS